MMGMMMEMMMMKKKFVLFQLRKGTRGLVSTLLLLPLPLLLLLLLLLAQALEEMTTSSSQRSTGFLTGWTRRALCEGGWLILIERNGG